MDKSEYSEHLWRVYAKEVGTPLICFILSGEDGRIVGYYVLDKTGEVTSQTRYNEEDETRETGTAKFP